MTGRNSPKKQLKAMETTRKEKIKKLRALASSPNQHEAALALEKAQAMESKLGTGKIIAHAIAELLAARGLRVCVQRHRSERPMPKGIDVVVRYRDRRSSFSHAGLLYEIEVSEWEWTGREIDSAQAKNMARASPPYGARRTC
jgi:hypothetical protein